MKPTEKAPEVGAEDWRDDDERPIDDVIGDFFGDDDGDDAPGRPDDAPPGQGV